MVLKPQENWVEIWAFCSKLVENMIFVCPPCLQGRPQLYRCLDQSHRARKGRFNIESFPSLKGSRKRELLQVHLKCNELKSTKETCAEIENEIHGGGSKHPCSFIPCKGPVIK